MRKNTLHLTDRAAPSLLLAGFLIIASQAAHATYTVIDDDLYPTAVIEARSAPRPVVQAPDHYTVPFMKERSPLSAMGRAVLDSMMSQMHNASIRIVGRPDSMFVSSGKLGALPRNRAINIRDYLTRQGVPAGSITIEADNSPNPQANGSSYPTDIYVTRNDSGANGRTDSRFDSHTDSRAVAFTNNSPIYTEVEPAPATRRAAPTVIAPAAAPASQSSDQLFDYINRAVLDGRMQPSVALKLLRGMMDANSGNVAPQTPQTLAAALPITPAPAPVPQFVATVALIRNDTWQLDKNLTLKANVDAWSKTAGWNPAVWDASNYFQVTSTSTLSGGFPDVLRKIADATGLNVCAKTREKYVHVTDANVSCK